MCFFNHSLPPRSMQVETMTFRNQPQAGKYELQVLTDPVFSQSNFLFVEFKKATTTVLYCAQYKSNHRG